MDEKKGSSVKVFERIVRWFFFSVLLALVPLVFAALRFYTRAPSVPLTESFAHILGRGDLLLIAAILSARASGELIGSTPTYRAFKVIASGSAVLILLFAALYFADVTAAHLAGNQLDVLVVRYTSMYIFAAAVVCSASCVALAEL